MRFHLAPRPLVHLLTAILFALPLVSAGPLGAVDFNQLFARDTCAGQPCGYNDWLCCPNGGCYTDANLKASCSTPAPTPAGAAATGAWQMVTTTITANGPYTVTSTYSTYLGAAPTATACNYALLQSPCGSKCCSSSEYCHLDTLQCLPAANGGSSGLYSSYYSTMYATTSAGVPLRPTSSALIVVTASGTATTATTVSTTTTGPFQSAVAPAGGNVTFTATQASSSTSLSGGAIAGIVIGVLLALFLLGLLCFYCCIKGLLDGVFAIFGLGRKRRERKEVDIYERHSHHAGGSAAVAGRTWYGKARPARVEPPKQRKSHETRNLLGVGAGLAALWAVLGMKRRQQQRRDEEKYSEYSYYSSDYYTSESSASSDRRTRDDRRSNRR